MNTGVESLIMMTAKLNKETGAMTWHTPDGTEGGCAGCDGCSDCTEAPHALDDFHVRCAAPNCGNSNPVCLSDCCGEECDGTLVEVTGGDDDIAWAHADCVEVTT